RWPGSRPQRPPSVSFRSSGRSTWRPSNSSPVKILLRAETGFRSEVEAERPHQAPVVVLAQGVAVGVVPAGVDRPSLAQVVFHAHVPGVVVGPAVGRTNGEGRRGPGARAQRRGRLSLDPPGLPRRGEAVGRVVNAQPPG